MRTADDWKPLVIINTDYFSYSGSYSDLVDSWGYDVVDSVVLGDYQGDILYVFRDGDEYGFLVCGYGSCSGCDALLACNSSADVERLRESLHSSVVWKSAEAMWDWVCGRDWDGVYYGGSDDAKVFCGRVLSKLVRPSLSSTSLALIANSATPPEIIADSLEEDGLRTTPVGLRDRSYSDGVCERLRKAIVAEPVGVG